MKQKKGTDYHSRTGRFAAYGEGTVCIRCRKKIQRDKESVDLKDPYFLYCPQCKKKLYGEDFEKQKPARPGSIILMSGGSCSFISDFKM